jgi:hypothetical protein
MAPQVLGPFFLNCPIIYDRSLTALNDRDITDLALLRRRPQPKIGAGPRATTGTQIAAGPGLWFIDIQVSAGG